MGIEDKRIRDNVEQRGIDKVLTAFQEQKNIPPSRIPSPSEILSVIKSLSPDGPAREFTATDGSGHTVIVTIAYRGSEYEIVKVWHQPRD
jgi:hypothetical protein